MTILRRDRLFRRTQRDNIVLSGKRLLIVEDEFIIALDLQRVVEEAGARQSVLARNYEEVTALGGRLSDFDLAIVSVPRPHTADGEIAGRLAAAGVAIVVCTGSPGALSDTPLAEAEIVDKTFSDEELLAACERALGARLSAA